MNKRIDWIDQIRGIAILLVVVGHIIQFNLSAGSDSPVYKMIYCFHMPLFFCISGFITQKVTTVSSLKDLGGYIGKKTVSILLPWLVWALFIERYAFSTVWYPMSLHEVLIQIQDPQMLWFLKSLFIMLLIYGAFRYLLSKAGCNMLLQGMLLLSVALCSYLVVRTGLQKIGFIIHSIAFYLGALLANSQRCYDVARNKYVFAFAVLAFMLLIGHYGSGESMVDKLLKIIVSLLSFVALLNILQNVHIHSKISAGLNLFGRHSLSIYILHFFFLMGGGVVATHWESMT